MRFTCNFRCITGKILQSQVGLTEVKSYLNAFKIKRRLWIYNVKDHSSKASLKNIYYVSKIKKKILSPLFISHFFEQLRSSKQEKIKYLPLSVRKPSRCYWNLSWTLQPAASPPPGTPSNTRQQEILTPMGNANNYLPYWANSMWRLTYSHIAQLARLL